MKKTFITKLLAFAVSSALSVSGAVSIAHHNSATNDAAEESVTASVIETYAAETSEVETMDETDDAVSVAATMSPAEKTETAKTPVAETAVSTEEVMTTAAATAVNTEKAATATVKTEEATEVAETETEQIVVASNTTAAANVATTSAPKTTSAVPANDESSTETVSSVNFVTVTGYGTNTIPGSSFVVTTKNPEPEVEEPEVEEPEVEEPEVEEPEVEEPEVEEPEVEEPEVEEPVVVQKVWHNCNCGWSTEDYEALKWHMLDHALKGEAYSYSTHVDNVQ